MYILTKKIVVILKLAVILVGCFIISTLICISQRKIINPEEITINEKELSDKVKIEKELEVELKEREIVVKELEKFILEKTNELQKNKAKTTMMNKNIINKNRL